MQSNAPPQPQKDYKKLLAKWTGLAFVRRKYREWNNSRKTLPTPTPYGGDIDVKQSSHLVNSQKASQDLPCLSAINEPTLSAFEKFSVRGDSSFQSGCLWDDPVDSVDTTAFMTQIRKVLALSDSKQRPNPRRHYRFVRTLGRGSFSQVKLAIEKETGDQVAIKIIDMADVEGSCRLQKTLLREIQILQRLDHPNVVRFRQVTLIGMSDICLIMDYVPGCELFDWVASRRRLTEAEAKPILRQILNAVVYLHANGVGHRDLKLENVLIVPEPSLRVVLIDFGLAKMIAEGQKTMTRCGSEEYAAPEVIMGEPYNAFLADAWSFGVIMYACLVGSLPFNPDPQRPRLLSEKIIAASYRFPEGVLSLEATRIICGLLQRTPSQRSSLESLLSNPFFSDQDQ